MFCGKCGAQNFDGSVFCKECGAPLGGAQKNAGGSAAPVQADQRNRLVGISAVAVAAVVLICLLITLFGGRSYKATATKFLDAAFDGDAKAVISLMPDKMVDTVLEEMGYDKTQMDDAMDTLHHQLQGTLGYLTDYFSDGLKISYEIQSAEDVPSSRLTSMKSDYERYDVKVSAAKRVEVKMIFKSGNLETSYPITIPVIKVGRSWYLDINNFSSIL